MVAREVTANPPSGRNPTDAVLAALRTIRRPRRVPRRPPAPRMRQWCRRHSAAAYWPKRSSRVRSSPPGSTFSSASRTLTQACSRARTPCSSRIWGQRRCRPAWRWRTWRSTTCSLGSRTGTRQPCSTRRPGNRGPREVSLAELPASALAVMIPLEQAAPKAAAAMRQITVHGHRYERGPWPVLARPARAPQTHRRRGAPHARRLTHGHPGRAAPGCPARRHPLIRR